MSDVVVAAPVAPRSDRSRLETAAAVRADIEQDVLDARGAERALEAADACVGRVGRQGAVAVFARRTKLEHGGRTEWQPAVWPDPPQCTVCQSSDALSRPSSSEPWRSTDFGKRRSMISAMKDWQSTIRS